MGAGLDLAGLAELDARIDAHIEALQIGGQVAWEVCEEALRWGEPGEVFVAGAVALAGGVDSNLQTALDAACQSDALSRGLISSFGWSPIESAGRSLERLLASEEPAVRRVGIGAALAHRLDPGPALSAAVSGAGGPLRDRALRAVGELGRSDQLDEVRRHVDSTEPSCRFSAAWTLALLASDPAALAALQGIAEAGGEFGERAADIAARRLPASDARAWIQGLASTAPRAAVTAAGALGDPALADWLIEAMAAPEMARCASAALRTITGLDTRSAKIQAAAPEAFASGPTDDPADPKVQIDPDWELPWPNRAAVSAWWEANSGRFETGKRHLRGQRMEVSALEEALRTATQRERAGAALELAIIGQRPTLFEVRAPGFRQQQALNVS